MKFKKSNAPHINYPESTRTIMINVIIALAVLYGMTFFYYGPRALLLGVISVATSVGADIICNVVFRRKLHWRDLSAIITGMIIPLAMPATIPFHIPAIAALFAIVVVKHPFGGVGHNVFNPAASGLAFAIISFTKEMFSYPIPSFKNHLPLIIPSDLIMTTSPALTVSVGGTPPYSLVSMLLGNVPGPMGATNILVLLACLFFLLSRRSVQWDTPVFFALTCATIAFAFPRAGITHMDSMLYEMMSGILLFGTVFMLGDPVTRPKRDWANVIYAVIAGIMVMAFRRTGSLEEEFVFALLLMNTFVWPIDMLAERISRMVRRKQYETIHS